MATYIIFNNRVIDPEKMGQYIPIAMETITAGGGEVLVFEEQSEILEGYPEFPRTIVIRFHTRREALDWYNSPAYREILPLRLEATQGTARMVEDFAG